MRNEYIYHRSLKYFQKHFLVVSKITEFYVCLLVVSVAPKYKILEKLFKPYLFHLHHDRNFGPKRVNGGLFLNEALMLLKIRYHLVTSG